MVRKYEKWKNPKEDNKEEKQSNILEEGLLNRINNHLKFRNANTSFHG